jgi:hypothetical protein
LDALEALHPGELRRILSGYIESYYDPTLDRRLWEARDQLETDLNQTRRSVLDRHQAEIDTLRAEYDAIRRDFEARMADYRERQAELWQAIIGKLEEERPDLDNYPLPEAREAREIGAGLYDSARDYTEQIRVYKAFQGKA